MVNDGSQGQIKSEIKNKMAAANVQNLLQIPFINLKSANLSSMWKNWYNQFKIFMRASGLENEDNKRKVALLLHHMGPEALEIFNSFNIDVDDAIFEDLIQKFETYFIPKVNIAMERHKFFSRHQAHDESIEEYSTVLKNLSLTCEFGNLREDLVRDIFICGLSDKNKKIKEKLLNEGNIKLEKALEISRTMEITRIQTQYLQHQSTEHVINQVHRQQKKRDGKDRSSSSQAVVNGSNKKCYRCGQIHKYRCPAIGAICNKCRGRDHYAKMCQSRTKATVKQVVTKDMQQELFLGTLMCRNLQPSIFWYVDIKVNNKNVRCQLDTGAQTNVMSLNKFKDLKLNMKNINNTHTKVITLSGERLKVVGSAQILCIHKNKTYNLKFTIISLNCDTILGLESCIALNLIKRVDKLENVIENRCNTESIVDEFKSVFDGLGCLKSQCSLTIKTNIQPVIECPRRIPFKLQSLLKDELDRMEHMGVIVKVSEPTNWVNSIVLVKKKNGQLRICLDPRHLNKAILRSHYQFPTVDEIKSQLSGAKYFSTLDANSGFWTIPLDEESSKLCTFITPFGRYRFLRLPFGIKAAPEIFQAEMLKYFKDIPGLIIYIDDFLIFSKTIEDHNKTLRLVLKRASEIGLKFNRAKSNFLCPEVRYVGHIFNSEGVKPDPTKVKAICEMPASTKITELQRFLGLINHLGSFIENVSEKTSNLRQLLKKDIM